MTTSVLTAPDGTTSLTYDTSGFVALLCSGFAIGMMYMVTRSGSDVTQSEADPYRREKETGLGSASLDVRALYNLGDYAHVGLTAGGEFWLSRLTAERPDGTELFRSRSFNASVQLGAGFHF